MLDRGWRDGQVVAVRAGFARNFLIPQGFAAYATPENVTRFGKDVSEQSTEVKRDDYDVLLRLLQRTELFLQRRADDGVNCHSDTPKAHILQALEKKVRLRMEPEDLQMPLGEDGEEGWWLSPDELLRVENRSLMTRAGAGVGGPGGPSAPSRQARRGVEAIPKEAGPSCGDDDDGR
eukprot:scaffold489_cov259-Pinguiococcus_pyrenoidosus.AAC.19